ncbi:transposase [Marinilactibacillus kalidii]|uniref:transposase n=1 Tax=Marinilactibacillus kalidii TaxID=2820274 RepID=UPI001ABD9F12|nr:transposase [Marinilactibacillus kalidii]
MLLAYSSELQENYRFYQELLHALKTKNFAQFRNTLKETIFEYRNPMKISQKTLHYHLEEGHIETAFLYNYSNGPLEGSNNKVENIKRTAYGFISFNSFRNRLVLSQKMKPKKK